MSQTAQHEAKVKQLELKLAQAKADLGLQKQQIEALNKGKEVVGPLASISQISQAEIHLHIQLPPMPKIPDFSSTQEEEQQGPAPRALDVKEKLKQRIEDMLEGPAKEYLLYEKKVMESTALAFLQPKEQLVHYRITIVLKVFKTFLQLVENQTGQKLKCLRTDNGGELYVSKAFQDFCEAKGIKREIFAPYNPSQNGVAKCMNRTIQEKVKSMLSNAKLPDGFWAKAVATAIHLINTSPSRVLEREAEAKMLWTGNAPSYKHLRIFGCEAYSHIPKEFRNKLEPKSKTCIFLDYGESGEMGYIL
ncbi:hypothetical protein L7F22_048034 [Adiantum nelumboides]|nr:hypothetical protein [Adiantum nelumboides]